MGIKKIKSDEISKYKEGLKNLQENSRVYINDYLKEMISEEPSLQKKYGRIFEISCIDDLNKIRARNGFYILLSDYNIESNKAMVIKYNDKGYKFVYRGESSNVKERITSHFIYDPTNKKYPSTMQVTLTTKDENDLGFTKVRINLKSSLFHDSNNLSNTNQMSENFIKSIWILYFIPLNKSYSSFRSIYEIEFDKIYGKPMFCND